MNIGDVFYEKHTVEVVSERTGEPSMTKCERVNAIEIPDHISNGEMLETLYKVYVTVLEDKVRIAFLMHGVWAKFYIDKVWWDAPFRTKDAR